MVLFFCQYKCIKNEHSCININLSCKKNIKKTEHRFDILLKHIIYVELDKRRKNMNNLLIKTLSNVLVLIITSYAMYKIFEVIAYLTYEFTRAGKYFRSQGIDK